MVRPHFRLWFGQVLRTLTMGSWFGVVLLLARAWPSQAYITYIQAHLPLKGVPPPRGSVWPQPLWSSSTGLQRVLTADSFLITSSGQGGADCDVLTKGATRYAKLIFFNAMASDDSVNSTGPEKNTLYRLHVTVSLLGPDHCRYPRFGDDESYNLSIPVEGDALLNSTTVWGALRGLETFSQLVYQDTNSKLFVVNETQVRDGPRFPYRGLLVDCVTRFLPVKTLKRNLDAMAYNKFNVFHWFLGGATAWRLELKAYPNLTRFARLPRHVYRQRDVQEVIEHARMRGIRVIPEIAISRPPQLFLDAFPGLVTLCRQTGSKKRKPGCPTGSEWDVADLSHVLTFEVYSTVFVELAALFRDEYMHLGTMRRGPSLRSLSRLLRRHRRRQHRRRSRGQRTAARSLTPDSPTTNAQRTTPDGSRPSPIPIPRSRRKTTPTEYGEDVAAKLQQFTEKILNIPRSLGFKLMVWNDGLNVSAKSDCRWCSHVPRDTVVQLWRDKFSHLRPGPHDLAIAGHRMIFSDHWNLSAFKYGEDWGLFYNHDPGNWRVGDAKNLVIGGEATLWTHIVDATNLIPRVWPRASAMAERLWSNDSIRNTNDAGYRLDEQRCRMLNRGIRAQPILNGFCGDQDLDYAGHYPEVE